MREMCIRDSTYIRLDSDSVLVRRESAVHQWTDFLHDGAMTLSLIHI